MRAIKIIIDGTSFLLPESHQFYDFPEYIKKHKSDIQLHIQAGKKAALSPSANHLSGLPDMSDFKRVTGIVGFPFNMHDPDMYALDRKIEITMEVEL